MDAFFQSQSYSGWSYDSFKNFDRISSNVQNHLKLVYLTLCCALVASAAGAYLHILMNVGGFLTMVGWFVSSMWLLFTPPYEEKGRFGLLMAASVFEGATIGPLIELAIDFDYSILITAFVGTAIAFACFSGAALVSKRREYLYLGGLLFSGLSVLVWLQLASSLFGQSDAGFKIELYMGLLIFIGYIVYDTQEIIERASRGELDYVKHAFILSTDFLGVFVRVLIIMLKNASEESEDRRKKKNNS